MTFLRRLFGGPSRPTDDGDDATTSDERADSTAAGDADAADRARELELLREESRRFDDLAQRQLRYARYAWTPPAQGGERRADDPDPSAEGGPGA